MTDPKIKALAEKSLEDAAPARTASHIQYLQTRYAECQRLYGSDSAQALLYRKQLAMLGAGPGEELLECNTLSYEARKQEDERYLEDPLYQRTPPREAYEEHVARQAKYMMEMYATPDPHTQAADIMFKLSDQLMTTHDYSYTTLKNRGEDFALKELAEKWFGLRVGIDLASDPAPQSWLGMISGPMVLHPDLKRMKEVFDDRDSYVGLLQRKTASPAAAIRNTVCHVCGKLHEGTFAYHMPCGHSVEIKVISWRLNKLETGYRASAGTVSAVHPTKEGAILEVRRLLGAR